MSHSIICTCLEWNPTSIMTFIQPQYNDDIACSALHTFLQKKHPRISGVFDQFQSNVAYSG
jgi:hypothetical protein